MTGVDPKCYRCGKFLPHSPGITAPGLCACDTKTSNIYQEPELFQIEGSEIMASVDATAIDEDNICRPIFVNQESECLYLTVADARHLNDFLKDAIPYLEKRVWEH